MSNPIVEARRQKIKAWLSQTGNCAPVDDIWKELFPPTAIIEEWCPVMRSRVGSFEACRGYGRNVSAHTHANVQYEQREVGEMSVYGYLRDLVKRGDVEVVQMGRKNFYRSAEVCKHQREAEIEMLNKLLELS